MPMTHATNQVALGEKLYFFRSAKPNENKCLIFAHGGHLWRDAPDFVLPNNLNLSFMQKDDGRAIVTNPWKSMFLNGKPADNTLQTIAGGNRVKEYSLGKGVGSHWERDTISYEEIGQQMAGRPDVYPNWCPHIVVVRRRFRCLGRLIPLSQAVAEINAYSQQQNLGIDQIYVAACRGDHSTSRFLSVMARI